MTQNADEVPAEGLNADIEEPFGDDLSREPGSSGAEVEDGADYERAVLEDSVLPVPDPAIEHEQGPQAPEFREPGVP